MHDHLEINVALQNEIDRLIRALASVDSGDFYGAYDAAEVATMRTSLQRLRTTLAGHRAHLD